MAQKQIDQSTNAVEVVELVAQLNQVIADLNTLAAKLNVDTGVNSTDYVGTTALGIKLVR